MIATELDPLDAPILNVHLLDGRGRYLKIGAPARTWNVELGEIVGWWKFLDSKWFEM
jgi:hypothetical protein